MEFGTKKAVSIDFDTAFLHSKLSMQITQMFQLKQEMHSRIQNKKAELALRIFIFNMLKGLNPNN